MYLNSLKQRHHQIYQLLNEYDFARGISVALFATREAMNTDNSVND